MSEKPEQFDCNLAVVFHRLGHYHQARLDSLACLGRVLAIEISRDTNEYSWERIGECIHVERVTLCPEGNSRETRLRVIRPRIEKTLSMCKPKLVAVPGWSDPSALITLSWCLRHRVPVILMSESQRVDKERHWLLEQVKSKIVRSYSAALVGGMRHRDYLLGLGYPGDRIVRGYDVVDNQHFADGAKEARRASGALRENYNLPRRYFLAVSRLIAKKNLERLLHAYGRYARKESDSAWGLVIVGDGPEMRRLKGLRKKLGLERLVRFTGFKEYAELPDLYGLASAFVHASTTEQWGLVVNEAMAAGLPVLVSNRCGCVPELVRRGVNGYDFDPYDTGELATLLDKVAADCTNLERMGRASSDIIAAWCLRRFRSGMRQAMTLAERVGPISVSEVTRAFISCGAYASSISYRLRVAPGRRIV